MKAATALVKEARTDLFVEGEQAGLQISQCEASFRLPALRPALWRGPVPPRFATRRVRTAPLWCPNIALCPAPITPCAAVLTGAHPLLLSAGPIQYDAAVDPAIAAQKIKGGSEVGARHIGFGGRQGCSRWMADMVAAGDHGRQRLGCWDIRACLLWWFALRQDDKGAATGCALLLARQGGCRRHPRVAARTARRVLLLTLLLLCLLLQCAGCWQGQWWAGLGGTVWGQAGGVERCSLGGGRQHCC